jgi:hypothetical protein
LYSIFQGRIGAGAKRRGSLLISGRKRDNMELKGKIGI